MLASFVLRLVPEALAQRRIVGRVEAVESGEAIPVRSAEELMSFLYGTAAPRGGEDVSMQESSESEGVRS